MGCEREYTGIQRDTHVYPGVSLRIRVYCLASNFLFNLWPIFEGSETVLPDLRAWWCHEDDKKVRLAVDLRRLSAQNMTTLVFSMFSVFFARRLSAVFCNTNKLNNFHNFFNFLITYLHFLSHNLLITYF